MRHFAQATLSLLLLSATAIMAEKPAPPAICEKEDLSSCKLPNGYLVLPHAKSAWESDAEAILNLADGKKHKADFKERGENAPKTISEMRDRLKTFGDLLFFPSIAGSKPEDDNGSWQGGKPGFWILSGRAKDLGRGVLSDFSGKTFERPNEVRAFFDDDKRKEPDPTPGVVYGIEENHVYLVEAVNGKFALLRVVQMRLTDNKVFVEFVYQPDGTRRFVIPKGARTTLGPATSSRSATTPEPGATGDAKVVDLNIASLLKRQAGLVKEASETLLNTKATVQDKKAAAHFLGEVRDPAGVPVLLESLAFRDPESPKEALPIAAYPCVAALVSIDKPASLAAVKEIAGLDLQKPGMEERLKLLVEVVRGVEGEEVGAFMLRESLASANEAGRSVLNNSLDILRAPPGANQK